MISLCQLTLDQRTWLHHRDGQLQVGHSDRELDWVLSDWVHASCSFRKEVTGKYHDTEKKRIKRERMDNEGRLAIENVFHLHLHLGLWNMYLDSDPDWMINHLSEIGLKEEMIAKKEE
jgi:hypothetical protein